MKLEQRHIAFKLSDTQNPAPARQCCGDKMKALDVITFALLFAAVILIVGCMGVEDELDEQRIYCAMVAEGTWPDYEGNAGEVCE